MLSEEVFKIILVAKNDGNSPAKNCWINHNMGKHISLAKNETFSADETEISLSSLPNLIKISDIDSGEERKIELLFKCPESAGTNNIDLVFYCEDESEKPTGQCFGLNLEHQIVGDIRRKVTVLPAPLESSERVLQVHLDSISDESNVTCRYSVTGCGMVSNRWKLVKETKQPCLDVSWIQGQNTGFLVYVTSEENDLTDSSENTEGRRPWRRNMTKLSRYSEVSSSTLCREFFCDALEFNVPEPTPEDDVVEHHWLEKIKAEKIALIVKWRAEIIDQNGMRVASGQSVVCIGDIFGTKEAENLSSPEAPPLRCYLNAPSRVEHNFSNGPMRIPCVIEMENTSRDEKVDLEISFRLAVEAAAGLNNNVSYTWTGISEKKLSIQPQKKCQLKNHVVFTRPGTFDLGGFTLTSNEIQIIPRSHFIVVNQVTT